MKKIKLLLAAAALMIGGSVSAQTDVTSTYITNADFSTTDGWTLSASSQYHDQGSGRIGTYAVANNKTSTTDETHLATEFCFGFQCRWQTNFTSYQQTKFGAELPAGFYSITYDVQNTNACTSATYNNLFYVKVGETTYSDTSTEWMSGSTGWTTHTISFTLNDATTADFMISLGYGTGSNNYGSGSTPHLYVSHLKLTRTDPLKAAKDALQAEIDKAKLCDAKEELAGAISTAEGVLASATTQEELATALTNLQAADKDAVLRYENGLADATYAAPVATSFVVNGTFDSGISPWQRTGTYQNNKTANNQSGAFTGNFYENWNGSAQANKMYQTISNIPNGTYRLDIAAFVNTLVEDPNESQFVFANNDKTYLTTGTPTAYEVYTVVTNNQIEIGLEQTTATANWMGLDNVSLRYYGAGDVINDAKNAAHKLAWQEAKAAAEAAVNDVAYENVTGNELTALQTEIGKAEPTTADGYDEAAAALTSATNAFTSAKVAYDDLAALWSNIPHLAYATSEKYVAIGDAYRIGEEVVDAADATSRAANMRIAIRAYYESHAMAEKVEGAVNCADAIAGADPDTNTGWTGGIGTDSRDWEKYTDADGNLSGRYYDGGWSTSAGVNINMSRSIEIPAGKYLLTVTARGSEALTSYTLSVGEDAVDLPMNGSGVDQGVFGHGWDDVSLEFESDGNPVTLTIAAASTDYQQWISFNRFRLMRLELNNDAYAGTTEYDALNSAIETADAYTLGFEDGQYAPYNNVAALEALAAAKAIDQTAELTNLKTDVTAATTALNDATWTANDGDVDAIYNGTFAETGTGSNPKGWSRSNNGWGQQITDLTAETNGVADGTTTAWYYNNNGAWQYGNEGVYIMPLAGNQPYKLSFKYSKHGNDWQNWMKASVVNGSDEGLEVIQFAAAENGTDFVTAEAYFTTGAAGNYILSIEQNGNAHLTDVSLVKAASAALALNEGITFEPINRTYIETVTLTRKVVAGYNTVCLPFDLTAEQVAYAFGENAKVYTYSETSDDADNVTINFNEKDGNTISANVPVLIGDATASTETKTFNAVMFKSYTGDYPVVTGNNFDFVGTYADCTDIPNGDYFIGNGAIYKSADETTIKAFRAYIKDKTKNGSGVKFFVNGEEFNLPTAIREMNGNASENGTIYNLAGQRVSNAQKGIYIVNGKKVIIK